MGGFKGDHCNYQDIANPDHSAACFMMLYAAFYGRSRGGLKLMKCLNLRGWQINGHDYDGRTALGLACSEGHLDIVKYLIVHGADVNHRDARGNNALDDAVREDRKDVIEYLTSLQPENKSHESH